MRALIVLPFVLLGFVADAHALLCARKDGLLASRPACKKHEHEVPISTLLPAPRQPVIFLRDGPTTVAPIDYLTMQHGTTVAAVALPSGETQNTGVWLALGTVSLVNHRTVADTVDCRLLLQGLGRSDAFGLLLGYSTVPVEAGSSTALTVPGYLPNVNPSTLQNGSGAVALWCSASAPESNITAATASLVAVPADQASN